MVLRNTSLSATVITSSIDNQKNGDKTTRKELTFFNYCQNLFLINHQTKFDADSSRCGVALTTTVRNRLIHLFGSLKSRYERTILLGK